MSNLSNVSAENIAQNCFDRSQAAKRFHGQVVIVTGASKGIGRGIADLFAKEGAKLVLVGRDTEQLETVKKVIEAKLNQNGTTVSIEEFEFLPDLQAFLLKVNKYTLRRRFYYLR